MLISAVILSQSSCKKDKDEGKLPNISFKTGAGYTSADATVDTGATVKIGITTSKAEEEDLLTKFTITRTIDTVTTDLYSKNLSVTTGDADSYTYDFEAKAGKVAQKEKYTFTVINRDGLVNKIAITLNVQ